MPVGRLLRARADMRVFVGFLALVASARGVSAQVPAPWTSADIGSPAVTGSTTYSSGTFTVSAGGLGITGRSDQFRFVYQAVTGDTTIVARVDTLVAADPGSQAGLMVRGSLDRSAPHAFVFIDGSNGSGFYRRQVYGGRTRGALGPAIVAPQWLALRRAGDTMTAYVSADRVNWTTVGTDIVPVGTTAYVGIAASARSTAQAMTATLSNVLTGVATNPDGTPFTSTTTLTTSLTAIDIGTPTPAGSTTESNGIYTMIAGGADIGGTSDQFHFAYRRIDGDVDIRARIDSMQAVDRLTQAGVMIRASLAASAPYTFSLLNGSNALAYEIRLGTGQNAFDASGGTGAQPAWVRLVRTGSRIVSYTSSDGVNWRTIESMDMAMPTTVYVGLAATSHNTTTSTRVVFSNLRVAGTTVGGNEPPTVSLTSPAASERFTAPATIAVAATAADPEGALARVEFHANGNLVGSDTAAPYAISWTSVPAGTYSLTATAIDASGARATSAPVSVTVAAANQPPTVTLTAPTNGQSFTAPASIAITANASDPENRLSRVDFLANGGLIGSDTTAPFAMTWSSVASGSYTVRAVAYDSDGASASSTTVSVTVTTATTTNQPPTVTITSPLNNQSFASGSLVTILASASDAEGRLAAVDFFINGTLIGTDTSAPYGGPWTFQTGTYRLTAVARDADGNRTESAAVVITVGTLVPGPTYSFAFTASTDHATSVLNYNLNVYAATANPLTATPIAVSNLGLPAPDAQNVITVDRTSFITGLPSGTYLLTVSAVNSGGAAQSSGIILTR